MNEVDEAIVALALTPQQAEIFRVLARHRGQWVSRRTIADAIYGHLANGGPDGASNTVAVQISAIRRTMAKKQTAFDLSAPGGARPYRLVAAQIEANRKWHDECANRLLFDAGKSAA